MHHSMDHAICIPDEAGEHMRTHRTVNADRYVSLGFSCSHYLYFNEAMISDHGCASEEIHKTASLHAYIYTHVRISIDRDCAVVHMSEHSRAYCHHVTTPIAITNVAMQVIHQQYLNLFEHCETPTRRSARQLPICLSVLRSEASWSRPNTPRTTRTPVPKPQMMTT
jgi:hypothetical protein